MSLAAPIPDRRGTRGLPAPRLRPRPLQGRGQDALGTAGKMPALLLLLEQPEGEPHGESDGISRRSVHAKPVRGVGELPSLE